MPNACNRKRERPTNKGRHTLPRTTRTCTVINNLMLSFDSTAGLQICWEKVTCSTKILRDFYWPSRLDWKRTQTVAYARDLVPKICPGDQTLAYSLRTQTDFRHLFHSAEKYRNKSWKSVCARRLQDWWICSCFSFKWRNDSVTLTSQHIVVYFS